MTDPGLAMLVIESGKLFVAGWLIWKGVRFVHMLSLLHHGSKMARKRNVHIQKHAKNSSCHCEVCTDPYYVNQGLGIGRDGSINGARTLTRDSIHDLFVPD